MYNKIELYADKTDIVLLETALNDLLNRIDKEGNKYEMSSRVSDLLAQLQIISNEIKSGNKPPTLCLEEVK
jgi:hypothetical protein